MLNFPTYSFFWFLLPFGIVGFIGTIYCIYEWKNHKDYEDQDYLKLVIASIVAPIFLLVGTFATIAEFISIYEFRSIDITTVNKLEIIESKDEYKSDEKRLVTVDDANVIQKMLKSLQNCQSYSRNHEHFQNGYKMKLGFSDEKLNGDYYFSVYRESSANKNRAVVIPHYYKDKNLNLGEFICPEFQELVKTHIEPLFQTK